jgi:hypothetical protein
MPTRRRIAGLLLIAAAFVAFGVGARPTAARVGSTIPAGQTCANLIDNGTFETDSGWEFPASTTPPQFSGTVKRAGNTSLQLGIVDGPNVESASSAQQDVALPPDAASAILSFWYLPNLETVAVDDRFEFAILDAGGTAVLAGPYSLPLDGADWRQAAFDLSAWRGQVFQIYFSVYNGGEDGRTAVFLDDVSLLSCLSAAGTPVPTAPPGPIPTDWPAPWPTSWPPPPPPQGDCIDVLQNGSFDAGLDGWTAGNNALLPSLAPSPALTPPFAAELGATTRNLSSFSSIRQTVLIPPGYDRTFIGFWAYTWAESLDGNDRQQFVLLGPGNVVWAVPWKVLESSETWEQHLYELTGAPSAMFDVYFAAVNDGAGGRTALYVDEVHVWACAAGAMPLTDGAGAMGAVPFSETAPLPETVPPMPDASPVVEPVIAPDLVITSTGTTPAIEPEIVSPEASVTPITVPFETQPPAQARGVIDPTPSGTPPPQGTPFDVSALPSPGWTEVAISGQPVAAPTQPGVAQSLPTGTPPPPEGRAVATPGMDPAALLTQAVAVVETVAPSPTRLPFGLLSGISERTAQWPIPWYWVLLIIVVVVVLLILLVRRSNRDRDYYS